MFGFGRTPKTKQIREIRPDLYYLPEFQMLDCSIYVGKDKDGNLLMIDTGNGKSWPATKQTMIKNNLDPKKISMILITHEHLDHVLGLYAILNEELQNRPKIIAHPLTAAILREGDENKICPGSLGISAKHFGVSITPLEVEELQPGSKISFGDWTFTALDTPGHSLGSLSYYEQEKKWLFPGDVVFPQGSFGRYDFPGGSLEKLQDSIKRLSHLDVELLASGHMTPVRKNANQSIQMSLMNIMSMRW